MSAEAHRLLEVSTLRECKLCESPLHQLSHLWLLPLLPFTLRCFLGNLFIIIILICSSQAWERWSIHRSRCHLYSPCRPNGTWAGQWAGVLGSEQPDQQCHSAGSLHLRQEQSLHQWWAVDMYTIEQSIHSPVPAPTSSLYSISLFSFLFRLYTPDPVHHISKWVFRGSLNLSYSVSPSLMK